MVSPPTLLVSLSPPLTRRFAPRLASLADMDSYVHRIGRTGRAGKTGTSVSFFVPSKNARLARELIEILNRTSQVIPDELSNCAGGSYRKGGGGGRGGRR